MFEKEAEDKALQKAQQKALREAEQKATQEAQETIISQETKQAVVRENESSACLSGERKAPAKEIVLACWDPELYHSKILWLVICLFGASFGALHLISWNTVFPMPVERWLWRAAALVSIFSMLVFISDGAAR